MVSVKEKLDRIILPIVIFIGQGVLLLAIFLARPPYTFSWEIKGKLPLRNLLLAVCLTILFIITVRFYAKYRRNPNPTRRSVLISFVFFLCSFSSYSYTSIIKYLERVVKHYTFGLNKYFLLLGIYFMLYFGLLVLITPKNEKRGKILKVLFIVLTLCSYITFFIGMLVRIVFHIEDDILLTEIADYLLYAVTGIGVIILLIMAINSLTIRNKTKEESAKKGLLCLGISFLIICGAGISLVLEEFLKDISDYLKITTLVLAIIAFYFIYMGFVNPSSGSSHRDSKITEKNMD
ncbi:MAG: hypothetical protein ACFFCS_01355 [Candidatus Hodarchaeota archaeon]